MADALTSARLDGTFALLDALPDGLAKTTGWDRAVRSADARGTRDHRRRARVHLLSAAWGAGLTRADRVLPAFAWLLADHDADPDGVAAGDLVRMYPAVLWAAAEEPAVGRDRLRALLDDFGERAAACGTGGDGIEPLRESLAGWLGPVDRFPAVRRPLDRLSAAADRAVPRWAGPLWWACGLAEVVPCPERWSVPGPRTGGTHEKPADLTDRLRRAARQSGAWGVRERAARESLPRLVGRAVRLGPHASAEDRQELYSAAALACGRLADLGDRRAVVRLPTGLPGASAGPTRPTGAAAALAAAAAGLAAAFDRRNGNGRASARLRRDRAFVAGRAFHW